MEKGVTDPNYGVKAHELHGTSLGMVAEYSGKAEALINLETGEVTYLPFGTFVATDGLEYVWDGEKDTWVDAVSINSKGEVVTYNKEKDTFAPYVDAYGNEMLATEQVSHGDGWLFVNDGVLTGSLDKKGNVTAAENDMVPIAFKVYTFENGEAQETNLSWFEWMMERENVSVWDLSNKNGITIQAMLDQGIFDEGGWDLRRNHSGAGNMLEYDLYTHMVKNGFFKGEISEFRDYIKNGGLAKITLDAWNVRTGEIESFTGAEVSNILSFYTASEPEKWGSPKIPGGAMYIAFMTSKQSRGFAYDPVTKSLISFVVDEDVGKNSFNEINFLHWPFRELSQTLQLGQLGIDGNFEGTTKEGYRFIKIDFTVSSSSNRLFTPGKVNGKWNYPFTMVKK